MHVKTSELIYYRDVLLNPKSLFVAVSQSGQSAEMIRLLKQNRRRASIIAVTNTADSPLAKQSNAVILTEAGTEFSVSCKTYVAALMALRFLGDELCGTPQARTRRELRAVVPRVRAYLSRWKEHVESIVPKISRVRHLFLAGRGPSLAAVGAGALILKESTQFPAEGLSSAAFRHGPFEMFGPESLLLIFSGDAKTRKLNEGLFNEARQREGYVELVWTKKSAGAFCLPQTSPATLPILEILPVQMLTLGFCRQSPGKHLGQFRFTLPRSRQPNKNSQSSEKGELHGAQPLHRCTNLADLFRDVFPFEYSRRDHSGHHRRFWDRKLDRGRAVALLFLQRFLWSDVHPGRLAGGALRRKTSDGHLVPRGPARIGEYRGLHPTFPVIIIASFVVGAGMASLQVAINPLLRVAGGEEHFAFNSAFAQLVFGAASFLSPRVYSYIVEHRGETRNSLLRMLDAVTPAAFPWVAIYWIFAAACVVMMGIIFFTHIPKVERKRRRAGRDRCDVSRTA